MKLEKIPNKKTEKMEKVISYIESSDSSEVEIRLYDEVIVGKVSSVEVDQPNDRVNFYIIEPYSMQVRKVPICGEEIIKVIKTKTFKV
jgi:hypothetical protein